jgi:hypothetical protein
MIKIGILLLFLTGCSVLTTVVYEPYWKPGVYTPYLGKPDIREVVDVSSVCQSNYVAACWIVGTPIVYIQAGLSPEDKACALNHEIEGHMKRGYGHGAGAMVVDRCFKHTE